MVVVQLPAQRLQLCNWLRCSCEPRHLRHRLVPVDLRVCFLQAGVVRQSRATRRCRASQFSHVFGAQLVEHVNNAKPDRVTYDILLKMATGSWLGGRHMLGDRSSTEILVQPEMSPPRMFSRIMRARCCVVLYEGPADGRSASTACLSWVMLASHARRLHLQVFQKLFCMCDDESGPGTLRGHMKLRGLCATGSAVAFESCSIATFVQPRGPPHGAVLYVGIVVVRLMLPCESGALW